MVASNVCEYREEFETDNDIIIDAGKFEGEHIAVPYFWDCAKNGDCETEYNGELPVYFFVIGDSEREEFPDLKDSYGLALYETEEGFVNSMWFDSRREYQDAKDNPEEVL